MSKTILAGEVTSKQEFMQQPVPEAYSYASQALAVTKKPEPRTRMSVTLDGYTMVGTEPGDRTASGGPLTGSFDFEVSGTATAAAFHVGQRVNLTLEAAPGALQAALKEAVARVEANPDLPPIRPDLNWASSIDGKGDTAAAQAQREGLPF